MAYAIQSTYERFDSAMTEAEQDTFNVRFSNFFEDFYSAESTPMALIAAKVERTTNQASTGASDINYVQFNSEVYDYGGFFDIGTPDRLIVPSGLGGLYQIKGALETQDTLNDRMRRVMIWKNGVNQVGRINFVTYRQMAVVVAVDLELVVGDYLQLAWQTLGESFDLTVAEINASLSLVRVPDGA